MLPVHCRLPIALAALASFFIEVEFNGEFTEERMAVFQSAADR